MGLCTYLNPTLQANPPAEVDLAPSEILPLSEGVELPVSGKGLFLFPHPFERRPSNIDDELTFNLHHLMGAGQNGADSIY